MAPLADAPPRRFDGRLRTSLRMVLVIGAVRPVWIAGPLALMGVALALWRILEAW